MNLYINGSNRRKNCYRILSDLKNEEDKLISLDNMSISYCIGCSCCINKLDDYCVIDDDMMDIYLSMKEADKIIIASPIYMNFITGILKNVIDRLNPYSSHDEILNGKKIYLILTGQLEEKENEEIVNNIKEYFIGLSEFMEFDFSFLKYLSSGDVEKEDDIKKVYQNYDNIIEDMKNKII